MESSRYLEILRRRWDAIALLVLLGMLGGLAATLLATPQYRATTTVFFSLNRGDTVTELVQGSAYTQNLARSFAQVATKPAVLEPVIRDLQLDTTPTALASRLQVEAQLDTVLVDIAATSPSAAEAAAVADAVARQLSTSVSQLVAAGPGSQQSVVVNRVAPAAVPEDPYSPNLLRNLAAGLLSGATLGVALAIGRDVFDSTVRDENLAQEVADSLVLGTVPFQARRSPVEPGARTVQAEALRRLRTNLLSLHALDGPSSVVVTSCLPGEGRTTTAIDLATTVSETGLRVLLVDADLRVPKVAEILGLHGQLGLSAVLLERASLAEAVQTLPSGLAVLTAGRGLPNPSEVLGSEFMVRMLADALMTYDLVVLDSSPLLPVTDATVLAQQTQGALLLVDATRTQRDQLARGVGALQIAGVPVLGVVLNKAAANGAARHLLVRRAAALRRLRLRRKRRAPTQVGVTRLARAATPPPAA